MNLLKKAHLLRCFCAHLCGVASATPPRSLSRALHMGFFKQIHVHSFWGHKIGRKGFTLVEVLLTMTILTLGVVFIHQGFSQCLGSVRHSQEFLRDSFLIRRQAVQLFVNPQASPTIFPEDANYQLETEHKIFQKEEISLDQCTLKASGPTGFKTQSTILFRQPSSQSSSKARPVA